MGAHDENDKALVIFTMDFIECPQDIPRIAKLTQQLQSMVNLYQSWVVH